MGKQSATLVIPRVNLYVLLALYKFWP